MYKYIFIFEGTAYNLLGTKSIIYAVNPNEAIVEVVKQINVVRKAKGQTPITFDPADYQSTYAAITALNDLISEKITKMLVEMSIFDITNTDVEPSPEL